MSPSGRCSACGRSWTRCFVDSLAESSELPYLRPHADADAERRCMGGGVGDCKMQVGQTAE